MAKTLTVRIREDLHKNFKLYALQHDTDMSDIIVSYIEQLINNDKAKSSNNKEQ